MSLKETEDAMQEARNGLESDLLLNAAMKRIVELEVEVEHLKQRGSFAANNVALDKIESLEAEVARLRGNMNAAITACSIGMADKADEILRTALVAGEDGK